MDGRGEGCGLICSPKFNDNAFNNFVIDCGYFFNVSYSKDILSAYFVAMKYEKTPKRNELLPLNYAYFLLCMQVGDLEREAQELRLQRAIEVICLFSKLYPCICN